MSLEVRHLKLVAAVAEEGTITRAANRLHLTQSALSHQLHDAEEQLGTTLFERTSKKMKLTSAGERVLASARTVLQELHRVEKDIESNAAPIRGKVRLTTQCYTVYHWLPSCLMRFMKTYTDVDVKVVVEATQNPFVALLEEKVDGVSPDSAIAGKTLSQILALAEEQPLVYLPSHDPESARRLEQKAVLQREDTKSWDQESHLAPRR